MRVNIGLMKLRLKGSIMKQPRKETPKDSP